MAGDPHEPAAIVSDASHDAQSVRVTTLGELGLVAKKNSAPAIIVIGENVRLREGLDWLGALKGERVLSPDPLNRARLKDAS